MLVFDEHGNLLNFQLPLSGSLTVSGDGRVLDEPVLSTPSLGITDEVIHLAWNVVDPSLSTPSLGITSATGATSLCLSELTFNSLSRDHEALVQRLDADLIVEEENFQLPLSGSLCYESAVDVNRCSL